MSRQNKATRVSHFPVNLTKIHCFPVPPHCDLVFTHFQGKLVTTFLSQVIGYIDLQKFNLENQYGAMKR